MVKMNLRDVWKYVLMKCGRQFVTMSGAFKRLPLYADSLDDSVMGIHIYIKVSKIFDLITFIIHLSLLDGSLAAPQTNSSVFGKGSTQETLNVEWWCVGNETNLLNCKMLPNSTICGHDSDAGVYCYGTVTYSNIKELINRNICRQL